MLCDSTKLPASVDEIKNLQCVSSWATCVDKTLASNDLQLETVKGIIFKCLCFGGRDDHLTMYTLHLPLAVFCFSEVMHSHQK